MTKNCLNPKLIMTNIKSTHIADKSVIFILPPLTLFLKIKCNFMDTKYFIFSYLSIIYQLLILFSYSFCLFPYISFELFYLILFCFILFYFILFTGDRGPSSGMLRSKLYARTASSWSIYSRQCVLGISRSIRRWTASKSEIDQFHLSAILLISLF